MVNEELEQLIELAKDKIQFFDRCTLEQFPVELSDSVRVMEQALAERKPVPEPALRTIQLSGEIAHRNLLHLVHNFDFPYEEFSPVIRNHFGKKMLRFFGHDLAHLSDSFSFIRSDLPQVARSGGLKGEMLIDPEFYPRRLHNINAVSERIARMHGHPWRLLKFLAERRSGIQPEYEPVSLQDHFRDVAEVLSLRFHADVGDRANPTTPLKKSFSIQGEDLIIHADKGLIWSIVYNNLKNSQKKFQEEEEEYFKSQGYSNRLSVPYEKRIEMLVKYIQRLGKERTSTASCYNLKESYVALVFSDSGSPVDLNKMVSGIRRLMQKGDDNDLDWVNAGMGQRYNAWAVNDYRFNRLTMEDVTNAAFMARVGGSETSSISSGMGLYGTRQIVESLGGAILYTTTFQEENPVFVYILPTKPVPNREEAWQLREKIIAEGLRVA